MGKRTRVSVVTIRLLLDYVAAWRPSGLPLRTIAHLKLLPCEETPMTRTTNRIKNIRLNQHERVGVRKDGDRIRLETEDEGCTAIVFLTHDEARKLAENLLRSTL